MRVPAAFVTLARFPGEGRGPEGNAVVMAGGASLRSVRNRTPAFAGDVAGGYAMVSNAIAARDVLRECV
jgi:hypothetical protein